MATAREISQDALEALQVYQPGELLRPADLARCFFTLNDMLDSWSNESLTTYATLEQSVQFIPGIYQYTIGVGGMIDAQRPLRLRHGFGTAYVLDQSGQRYPLEVIQRDRWNLIGNITQVNADIPLYLWYEPENPLGVLSFYPIPNIAYTAYFDSYLRFTRFPDPDTPVEFPEGYELALKRNLAWHVKPYYPNGIMTAELKDTAERSKGNVKRTNFRETIAKYDQELVSRAKATYNIFRDTGV